jgi:hypothetical protein
VGVDVVRIKVSPVDQASVDGVRIAPAVVLEGRLPEVGREGRVGDPSSGLLELDRERGTFSMSFAWSPWVISCSSFLDFSSDWP